VVHQATSYNPQLADPGLVLVSSDVYLVDPGNEFDGYRVLFGQKRAAPNLSTKKEVPDYLKGRSIKDVATDLDNGKLAVDQIHIEVFEYNGVLVSTNTRGLAP
jgi:hypothetical protein